MTRKTSEFLKAFGTSQEIFKAITDEVLSRGGGDDDLRRILSDQSLRRKLGDLIVAAPRDRYSVTVNYDQSLKDMIAAGRYDYVNADITAKNFPINARGKTEVAIELVHFDRRMTSEEVLSEFDKRGLRAAILFEGLAFAAANPDLQRQFPIVFLGSVRDWLGYRDVPCLGRDGSGRGLYLSWFEVGWGEPSRFAAVRK